MVVFFVWVFVIVVLFLFLALVALKKEGMSFPYGMVLSFISDLYKLQKFQCFGLVPEGINAEPPNSCSGCLLAGNGFFCLNPGHGTETK